MIRGTCNACKDIYYIDKINTFGLCMFCIESRKKREKRARQIAREQEVAQISVLPISTKTKDTQKKVTADNSVVRLLQTVGDIPSVNVGAYSEYIVSIDLMNNGYEVFKAISSFASTDLIIKKGNELKTVQVKTGRANITDINTLIYKMSDKAYISDVLAVVDRFSNRIFYQGLS